MTADLFSLAGRVALVTGASRGIGYSVAESLAEAGATVILNGRHQKPLEMGAAKLHDAGLSVDTCAVDVTDAPNFAEAVDSVILSHGQIDILINNAGIIKRARLVDTELSDWQQVLDTNLTGMFIPARVIAQHMIKRGYGRIVNMASILALIGREDIASYVTSKHGVVGLTRALAAELGPKGITCNAIAPGYIRTEINTVLQQDKDFSEMVISRTPVGRWGEPNDVAAAALFLSSHASAYINGHILVVDGGMTETL